jgi:transposase
MSSGDGLRIVSDRSRRPLRVVVLLMIRHERRKEMASFDLTDHEWGIIAPHLPRERGRTGRPSISNRQILNGILWLAREGARWRALPERYGNWNTVWRRFSRWSRAGVFERLFAALTRSSLANERVQMLDSTIIRAHQHAAGAKGGRTDRALVARVEASRPSSISGLTAMGCRSPLR